MKEEFKFYVAGVQHHDLKTCIDEMEEGYELSLIPEPSNKYDPNAIKICFYSINLDREVMCGYVPGKISAQVSAFLATTNGTCEVFKLSPEAKPWQQLQALITEVEDA